jgi:hypothetical protein
MASTKRQNRIEKQKVIHWNCYKLFLCNLELKYIFEEAEAIDIANYNLNRFLIFYVENLNINFCLLSSILISEKEEFSLTKFLNEFIQDGKFKKQIWDILYDYDFQRAWRRIKTLRDRCYAHSDKEESRIKKEIQLTQNERNIITNGLTKSIELIYLNFGDGHLATFEMYETPGIKAQLRIIREWKEYKVKDLKNKIRASKQK